MYDNEDIYDEGDGQYLEIIEVTAFNPSMSFDEDEEDRLIIEQLSVVCKVEYIDEDGDGCVAWFDAILNDRGLHFDGPNSLMSEDESNDWLYECVTSAFEEVIDSTVYDLGYEVDHTRIPVSLRDAVMTFEMIDDTYVHVIGDSHYVCTHEYLNSDGQGASLIGSAAPFYVVERNSDFIIPIQSAAEYVSVVNNLDDEFQRLRLQQHVSAAEQTPTEVQRSQQVRRM
ncbi:hypothetical protein NJG17_08400 [Stenotrophomonas maltophilia]|jgi:hypothetical protein|uniref:hypothetical protein n=1 Tax=Stenotrophomonas TaxID=40323 RepID=UPI000B4E7B3B|nr:hypothetical protein [Stenotrophomonas maltophilia]MBH1463611.1 hypothetical protein [Stenotrophomonas maltophilia]MBH1613795.1 hypothetical protein [Stenotrophomonas maltophilia]MBN5166268.1 hypothetical protein [Stenotrophomonas maltophilia]MCO7499916.1 hypothetical protein [Stenotrophomonas maltophilia]OWQ59841.1 hypothetical protein CEE59_06125 [Stenotrophomonas maltophilia]